MSVTRAGLTLHDISRGPHVVAVHLYHDAYGHDFAAFARKQLPDGTKRFAWFRAVAPGRFVLGEVRGNRKFLYRLPRVLAAVRAGVVVDIVEGEKCADAMERLGLVATTNPNGAGSWRPEYDEHLRGARVRIWADNDAPGEKHALTVAHHLFPLVAALKIVRAPGLEAGGDVADLIEAGATRGDVLSIAVAAPPLHAPPPDPTYRPAVYVPPPSMGALSVFDRASRWLAHRPPAVEGQGGDRHTFKAACALVNDFQLADDAALALLKQWNVHCCPPWSESALVAKIASARRSARMPAGSKLEVRHA